MMHYDGRRWLESVLLAPVSHDSPSDEKVARWRLNVPNCHSLTYLLININQGRNTLLVGTTSGSGGITAES